MSSRLSPSTKERKKERNRQHRLIPQGEKGGLDSMGNVGRQFVGNPERRQPPLEQATARQNARNEGGSQKRGGGNEREGG